MEMEIFIIHNPTFVKVSTQHHSTTIIQVKMKNYIQVKAIVLK